MKQRFVEMTTADSTPNAMHDGHDLMTRTVERAFRSIGMAVEHGEYYAHPTHPMISGWRQQGLEPREIGDFVEYNIRLLIGVRADEYSFGPQQFVEAIVDDGIDQ